MVGDVGREVGVLAVRLDEDAVLVVAKGGRLEPQGAVVGLVQVAHLVELVERAVDLRGAGLVLHVERALREPQVKRAADLVARRLDASEHGLVAALAELLQGVLNGHVHPLVAVGRGELARDVHDVVAAIGVPAELLVEGVHVRVGLGTLVVLVLDVGLAVSEQLVVRGIQVASVLAHDLLELQVAPLDGASEHVHLRAVVVDVVLAVHVVAREVEHVAHGVAERSPAAMAHVQGTGRVRRDELVVQLQAVAKVAPAPVGALLAHLLQHLVVRGGVQVEVDEAGTCDLHLRDGVALRHVGDDRLRDLCGGHVGKACGAHRDGGAPVAVRRVGGTLDAELLHLELRQVACGLRRGDRLLDKLLYGLRHTGSFSFGLRHILWIV